MTTSAARVVRVHEHGGPDVLRVEEIPLPSPGPGEAQVRHEAVGLNFIDVYQRTGLYPKPLPFVPGQEAAGVVTAVGEGVAGLAAGDRVVWMHDGGGYANARNIPAERLTLLPAEVSAQDAAAIFMKGVTAEMLLFRLADFPRDSAILVHAAAGGVGLILCRWAASLGHTVIGAVGSEAKAERARAAGCAHAILYDREDVAARVRELTGGKGVHVVFDSVGKATQTASLDSLSPRGWYVNYGNASGPADPIAPLELAKRGSLFMTRPTVITYTTDKAERDAAAARLFAAMAAGHVRAEIGQTFALGDVANAHRAFEARATTGSTVLLP